MVCTALRRRMARNKLFVRLTVDRRLGLSALQQGPHRPEPPGVIPRRRQVREPRAARAREVRSAIAGGHGDEHLTGPAHLNGKVRPGPRLEGHVEMLKAQLAVAEAVGAGACQAGEGYRRVLGARGPATSALAAAAHGLRLALPGAFPSTTPPRLFDHPSIPTENAAKPNPPKPNISIAQFEASEVKAMVNGDTRTTVVSGETWACGAA